MFARSAFSEVLVRVAIEQIKMYVHRNARCKDKTKNPNRQAIRRKNKQACYLTRCFKVSGLTRVSQMSETLTVFEEG